jgi:hypothetical protein
MIAQHDDDIRAALAADAWAQRRFRRLALETQNRASCLTAEAPTGEPVRISCAEELFALIALANAALPDSDPRKITFATVEVVQEQANTLDAEIYALQHGARRLKHHASTDSEILSRQAEALRPKVSALRQVVAVLRALLPQVPASSS